MRPVIVPFRNRDGGATGNVETRGYEAGLWQSSAAVLRRIGQAVAALG
jgi:hypothetical protein